MVTKIALLSVSLIALQALYQDAMASSRSDRGPVVKKSMGQRAVSPSDDMEIDESGSDGDMSGDASMEHEEENAPPPLQRKPTLTKQPSVKPPLSRSNSKAKPVVMDEDEAPVKAKKRVRDDIDEDEAPIRPNKRAKNSAPPSDAASAKKWEVGGQIGGSLLQSGAQIGGLFAQSELERQKAAQAQALAQQPRDQLCRTWIQKVKKSPTPANIQKLSEVEPNCPSLQAEADAAVSTGCTNAISQLDEQTLRDRSSLKDWLLETKGCKVAMGARSYNAAIKEIIENLLDNQDIFPTDLQGTPFMAIAQKWAAQNMGQYYGQQHGGYNQGYNYNQDYGNNQQQSYRNKGGVQQLQGGYNQQQNGYLDARGNWIPLNNQGGGQQQQGFGNNQGAQQKEFPPQQSYAGQTSAPPQQQWQPQQQPQVQQPQQQQVNGSVKQPKYSQAQLDLMPPRARAVAMAEMAAGG